VTDCSDAASSLVRLGKTHPSAQSTLRSLQESEAFTNLSFVGGTALRFLFSLPRFSEIIDFSLEHTEGYALRPWSAKLRRDLEYAGFQSSLSLREQGTAHAVWIRTAALLRDAGLAAMSEQKLAIKVEIDTRSPGGAICHKRLVTRQRVRPRGTPRTGPIGSPNEPGSRTLKRWRRTFNLFL